jgi:hypothetical protein
LAGPRHAEDVGGAPGDPEGAGKAVLPLMKAGQRIPDRLTVPLLLEHLRNLGEVSLRRLLDESPWWHLTSECQRC